MNALFQYNQSGASHGSRPYIYLDGLRGVAAIAVVLCHFASRTDLSGLFAHGYLAVDFFFVLSGFVLAYAYHNRLREGEIGLGGLFLLRAIRLLPLVALGTLIAVAIETQRPGIVDQGLHWREIIAAFVMGTLLLPIWWTTTLEMLLFPLNLPVWSLFFEAVANGVAAPMAQRRNMLIPAALFISLSAAVLIWVGVTFHTLDVGYSIRTFWYGFARVFFSFFAGALIYFSGIRLRQIPPYISAMLFVSILAVPRLDGVLNGVFDLIAVMIAFPLIVAHVASFRPASGSCALCTLAGELSYPIYALHYPIVRAMGVMIRNLETGMVVQLLLVMLGTILIVVVSWFAYRFYDAPLRSYLTQLLAARTRRHSVPARE